MTTEPQPTLTFTVTLNTDADTANLEIEAASPEAALAEAHIIRNDKQRLAELCFEPWVSCPVNEIVVFSPDGDEIARWRDDELTRRLAAQELLVTLKRALVALNTAPRFDVPALDCDSYAVAAECNAAIAEAEGRANNSR